MDAEESDGTLTTRPLVFTGGHFFVNAAAREGEMRAEALDAGGQVIAVSKPFRGDATKQRIEWTGRADLTALGGQPVRFRFHLRNGQLYAFWLSSKENGASGGYVAAGGPGFVGARDE